VWLTTMLYEQMWRMSKPLHHWEPFGTTAGRRAWSHHHVYKGEDAAEW